MAQDCTHPKLFDTDKAANKSGSRQSIKLSQKSRRGGNTSSPDIANEQDQASPGNRSPRSIIFKYRPGTLPGRQGQEVQNDNPDLTKLWTELARIVADIESRLLQDQQEGKRERSR